MDLHPTPFPGKRLLVARSTAKEVKSTKVSKKPPWQPPTAADARTRPKRTFGVVRSSNIPVEKPILKPLLTKIDKVSKPRKPSVASAIPTRSNGPEMFVTERPSDIRSGSERKKASSKNNQHVSFQEPKSASSRSNGKGKKDDVVCTPVPLVKTVALDTPYLSAQNCSKCRLDKLEVSTYWLTQIRLAESVGKHFVSAAFFRLALECHAQPFHKLQSELRSYIARHQVNTVEPVWVNLCKAYSLPTADLCIAEQKNTLLVEFEDSMSKAVAEFCKLDPLDVSLMEEEDSTLFA